MNSTKAEAVSTQATEALLTVGAAASAATALPAHSAGSVAAAIPP